MSIGIEVIGELETNTQLDHFVIVSVDEEKVLESEKKPGTPAPKWEWKEDSQLWVCILPHLAFWSRWAVFNWYHLDTSLLHPPSTIKVVIYRKSRTGISKLKHLVGQHTSEATELLENGSYFRLQDALLLKKSWLDLDETIDLEDETGTRIPSQIKIQLSVVPDPAIISSLGMALKLTKDIMNITADDVCHCSSFPVCHRSDLGASWIGPPHLEGILDHSVLCVQGE